MTAPVVLVAGVRAGCLATTVSANVGGLAASAGTPTLVVALDAYADVALDLGTTASTDPAVRTVRPGLDLLTFGTTPPARDLVARALRNAREQYELIVIDGSSADEPTLALAIEQADHRLLPTRADRAAIGHLVREIEALPGSVAVVVAGVSGSPRSQLVSTRRALASAVPSGVPIFAAALRAEVGIAWWARDRGVLVHELVADLDRDVLDDETVQKALRLAQDHRDVTSELLARIGVESPE